MKPLTIGDQPLTIEDIVSVARDRRVVQLSDVGRARVQLCRAVVEKLLYLNIKVYGLTTGFASMRNIAVKPEQAAALSRNLIRSHSAGVGDALPEDVVRAAMLLRAQALAQGNSGVTDSLIDVLVALLNAQIYPYIPEHGSVGCSGDLAPLSHLALVVIGDDMGRVHRRCVDGNEWRHDSVDREFAAHVSMERGHVSYISDPHRSDFVRLGAVDSAVRQAVNNALAEKKLETYPHALKAKEGLALNNGAVFTTAALALACYDAERLLKTAELATALSYEAHQAVLDPLHSRVTSARPHRGHVECANHILQAVEGSDLVRPKAPCGLNMSWLNRVLMRLRGLELSDDCKDGADKQQIEDLRILLQSAQNDAWKRVQEERKRAMEKSAPGEDKAGYPKALELRACRRAMKLEDASDPSKRGELDLKWRTLVGLESGAPLKSAKLKEAALKIYFGEFANVVREVSSPQVQDNYSFRGAATVLGSAQEAIWSVRGIVEVEANSATDNPLVLIDEILDACGITPSAGVNQVAKLQAWLNARCEEVGGFVDQGDSLRNWAVAADAVRSAANFHGQPVGIAADHLSIAIAEVGQIAERRCATLLDHTHSNGLPSYLAWNPGLNSGFMIAQYCAASIVSESKILAVPASVDSIPTGENTEDHVSMSFLAARKAAKIVGNAEYLVAIELLTSYQAVQFRKPASLGRSTARVEQVLSERLAGILGLLNDVKNPSEWLQQLGLGSAATDNIQACVLDDVVLAPAIDAVADLVRRGEIAALAE